MEKFRQKYNISQVVADQIIAKFTPQSASQNAIQEYSLMYQAFLENDGEIDLEEQAHLLELQEELGLTNEEVARVEMNIQAELNTVNNH